MTEQQKLALIEPVSELWDITKPRLGMDGTLGAAKWAYSFCEGFAADALASMAKLWRATPHMLHFAMVRRAPKSPATIWDKLAEEGWGKVTMVVQPFVVKSTGGKLSR